MKKILLPFFVVLGLNAMAQNVIFQEDWDGNGPGVDAWTIIDADGLPVASQVSDITNAWVRLDRQGTRNLGGPAGNFAMVSTSWYSPPGRSDDWLISPTMTIEGTNPHLSWNAKAQDNIHKDGYKVMLSPSGGNTVADFTVTLFTVSQEESSWTNRYVDLSSYVGQNVRIAFVNNSLDKFLLLVDDIEVVRDFTPPPPPDAPHCVVNMQPANGATNVGAGDVNISWQPATEGGTPASYDIYLGETPEALQFLGNVTGTSAVLRHRAYGTTYYWKVVAKNSGGEAANCSVYSFRTEDSFVSPYCGPIVFSYAVEPITKVSFADLENITSAQVGGSPSHEDFISMKATVKRNNTYQMKLQGNTDGDYFSKFVVFIDWNKDGKFEGTQEIITVPGALQNSTGEDGKEVSVDITVPNDAIIGDTRMRIKKTYVGPNENADTEPCRANIVVDAGQAEEYTISIQEELSTNEVDRNVKIKAYPNPVIDVLNISSHFNLKSVTVYDMKGKMVLYKDLGTSTVELDLSNLLSGMYMVAVEYESSTEMLKVLKR